MGKINTPTKKYTCGIVYVAVGSIHIESAVNSAKSVKKHSPMLPCTLFTEKSSEKSLGEEVFDNIEYLSNPHRRSKVDVLSSRLPYDYNLYLDGDTKIFQNIYDVFKLLDNYDMCGTHEFIRNKLHNLRGDDIPPEVFPQINTGVLLIKKNSYTKELLEKWKNEFYQSGDKYDQPSFRKVLWYSNVKFYVLPREYNIRYSRTILAMRNAEPKILHLHGYTYKGIIPFLKRILLYKFKSLSDLKVKLYLHSFLKST